MVIYVVNFVNEVVLICEMMSIEPMVLCYRLMSVYIIVFRCVRIVHYCTIIFICLFGARVPCANALADLLA